MRGLPFPQDAAFERETSYEYGTPASNLDDIPIDPALADPSIDPSLQAFPVKLDSDQVRVSLSFSLRDATWCRGCGAHTLIDRVASRPLLFFRATSSFACCSYPAFRMTFPCPYPRILLISFANIRKVHRAIHLLSLLHQSFSPQSLRPYSPPNLRKRRREYAESQIAASVAGMTRRTRLVNLRRWSLVTSAAAVVGLTQVASYCYIERNRPPHLYGSWHSRYSRPLLPLEVCRMQDMRNLPRERG